MKKFLFVKLSFLSSFGNLAISIFNIFLGGIIISGSLSAQTLKAKQESVQSGINVNRANDHVSGKCGWSDCWICCPHKPCSKTKNGGYACPECPEMRKKIKNMGLVEKTSKTAVKCGCGTGIYAINSKKCDEICELIKNSTLNPN